MKLIAILFALLMAGTSNTVTKVERTDTGMLCTFEDGTGYYMDVAETDTGALFTFEDGTGYYFEK